MLLVPDHRSTHGEHCKRGHADVQKGHAINVHTTAENMVRRHVAIASLSDLAGHVTREFQIAFGVHLGDVERLVAETCLRRLDAEEFPDFGAGRMAKLVREPVFHTGLFRRSFDCLAV